MENENNIDSTVDSILSQLKNSTSTIERVQTEFKDVISKENLEEFVINQSSNLVKMSSESLDYVKDIVQSAPTPDDICAMAELVKSTSIVLDLLNKIVLNDKKLDVAVKLKEMDIQSKKEELDTKVGAALLMGREELMKNLLDKSKLIEVESEVIEPQD